MQIKINIKPSTYIYIVLLLFMIPMKWLFAWLFAAGVHELSHWIGVKICGGEIYSIVIGIGGAEMVCSAMPWKKQLFAILCGPLGGLLPMLFAYWMPYVAVSCCLLTIYNLLPLRCLDGGKVVETLIGTKVIYIEKICLVILSVVAIYISVVLKFTLLPLAIVAFLWAKSRNNPCKRGACKVQ